MRHPRLTAKSPSCSVVDWRQPEIRMGRHHRDPAVVPVRFDGFFQCRQRGGIEGNRWFIEQPERRWCRQNSRQGEPSTLPRRQQPTRNSALSRSRPN